jgi:fatty acid desaturase
MSTTAFTADEQQAIEEKGFLLRMVCLPAAVVGICGLAWHWPVDALPVRVVWTCFTAYFLFCWTSCFHETAHQTLTRWRWLDIALGRVLGTLMYVPYTVYRESHIRHHAYLNRPNDWELWPYSNPNCSRAFRRVFVLFDICFGFIASPIIYGRIYFHRDSPLKSAALRRTVAYEYCGIVLFWGLVFLKLALTNTWSRYFEVWLIPHMIAGVFQTMRKLTEHLGMASYDPMLGTRTVVGKNWLTRLGSFMNFDIFIHGPHHRHPRLAQNLLKGKMDQYLAENPGTNYPVYPSYLRATTAMLPFLFTNPGIGMNAGAAPPDEARVSDATYFPADVTREIHQ